MNSRQRRIEIFRDTQFSCLQDPDLAGASEYSRQHTQVLPEAADAHCPEPRFTQDCSILITKRRSLEAAETYKGQGRVCVLNFASALNPGGGAATGSGAQEECLCRCSTLYFALNTPECLEQFYYPHRRKQDPFYNDDCIYTEDVCVFKTDTLFPEPKKKEEYFLCDVISCAAPNYNEICRKGLNAGRKELSALFRRRCGRILETAAGRKADILILGAFGCGAFGNDPELAAEAMKEAVQKYRRHFRQIEFAVYCPPSQPQNYEVFRSVFSSIA